MNLIEVYKHEAEGYNPSLISDGWQAAFLNYADAEKLESIEKLDIHYLTDEVFVLLEGESVLIAAEIKNDQITYDLINMKPGIIYNIPKNTWHKIAMQKGSKVCIVEKDNTHLGDFEFYDLSEEQKADLRNAVNQLLTAE